MPAEIQLQHIGTSVAEKAWIKDLLNLSLDKKSLQAFIRDLIIKSEVACYLYNATLAAVDDQSDKKPEIVQESFVRIFVPINDDEKSDYNPSDDLLYRLKLLDVTFNLQYSKTLYAEILHYRAFKMMLQDTDTQAHLGETDGVLTRRVINNNPYLYEKYREISYRIDDELGLLVGQHKHDVFYRCEISDKIAELFKHFEKHQGDLQSLFVFLKLGETLHAEFPAATIDDFTKTLCIFTSSLDHFKINQYISFELAKVVNDNLITRVNTWNIYFGMKVFSNYLPPVYQTPISQSPSRERVLVSAATKYIHEDLMALSHLRCRLDLAINDIILYGRKNALIPDAKFKSDAALDLGLTLRSLSDSYFSNPDKEDELQEKFHADCLLAVKNANIILGEHRTPRWKYIVGNVLLAVSAIVTLGLSLVAKRYYSKATTGYATFFNDRTRGMGKTKLVADMIEKEKAALLVQQDVRDVDGGSGISMTRVSRSSSR
jgi:hypothetical protein